MCSFCCHKGADLKKHNNISIQCSLHKYLYLKLCQSFADFFWTITESTETHPLDTKPQHWI